MSDEHSSTDYLRYYSAMVGVYAAMPVHEKNELHAWEAEHLGGGTGTSEWRGWRKYLGNTPQTAAPEVAPPDGFVYCMHVPGMKAVKIGLTKGNVKDRAKQLGHLTGFHHVPVWHQRFDNCYKVERQLHRALRGHRIRASGPFNEYFRLGK